jgi:transcriptional regulator with XRE-family HTH domain
MGKPEEKYLNLEAGRIRRGLLQSQLKVAKKLGISQTRMSKLEQGELEATKEEINSLADILGVTPDQIRTKRPRTPTVKVKGTAPKKPQPKQEPAAKVTEDPIKGSVQLPEPKPPRKYRVKKPERVSSPYLPNHLVIAAEAFKIPAVKISRILAARNALLDVPSDKDVEWSTTQWRKFVRRLREYLKSA